MAHLQQRKVPVEERLAYRCVEQAKEGCLRADTNVERRARVRTRLCDILGRCRNGEVG